MNCSSLRLGYVLSTFLILYKFQAEHSYKKFSVYVLSHPR